MDAWLTRAARRPAHARPHPLAPRVRAVALARVLEDIAPL